LTTGGSSTAWPLATRDGKLVAERNDLELQFHAAAKPDSEPGKDRHGLRKHASGTNGAPR
jgi:hypothetical protein